MTTARLKLKLKLEQISSTTRWRRKLPGLKWGLGTASPFNFNHKFHTGCKATYTIPIHQSLETLSWKKNDKLEQMPSPRQSFQLKPVVADPQINSSLSGRLSDVLLYFLKWLEIWWSPPFLPTLNYCPLPSFCGGAAAGGFKPPRRAPAPWLWCLHYICQVPIFSSLLFFDWSRGSSTNLAGGLTSPISYPASQSVSRWLIISDCEDSYCFYRACKLVLEDGSASFSRFATTWTWFSSSVFQCRAETS